MNSTSWYQQFEYDNLNRLQWAKEFNSGGSQLWRQEYVYDRYGNRTINATLTSPGINSKQFTVDAGTGTGNTNRLFVPNDPNHNLMSYDVAGNLSNDAYTASGSTNGLQTRFYDAENRLVSAPDNQGGNGSYTYDGEGRRVRRKLSGVETWHVYSFDGQLLAEYAANGEPQSPKKEYGYRNGQLLITAAAPVNVALAGNGGVATATSSHASDNFPPVAAINGDRTGATWGSSTGGWNRPAHQRARLQSRHRAPEVHPQRTG